jgi:hypothetical protein
MLTDSGICCPRRSALVSSRQLDRENDDEINSHLAEATAEYAQQGLSAEEARLAAQTRRHWGRGQRRSEPRGYGWRPSSPSRGLNRVILREGAKYCVTIG